MCLIALSVTLSPPLPGRVSHKSLLPEGCDIVAPSAIGMTGQLYVEGGVKVPYEVPQALDVQGINSIINDFARAAEVAVNVRSGRRYETLWCAGSQPN